MAVRDGSITRTARPAANAAEGSPTPAAEETPAPAPQLVKVYSLTGVGFVDERFGVSFVDKPFAEVPQELADRMVAFRPEVVLKDEAGHDVGVGPGPDPIYSLDAPAAKAPEGDSN